MPQTPWSMHQIKQCEQQLGQAMLRDEHSLVSYSADFGKLSSSRPSAVFVPQNTRDLQYVLSYAHENGLPVTVRAKGLSQGGQTLAVEGGLTVHMEQFNQVHEQESDCVWVDANATWSDLLAATVPYSRVPWVVPYNTHLSVAGLLSIGGVGSASFRHGIAAAHVKALDVVTADGELQRVDATSPLFQACLGGQGHFGVITKVAIPLRPCARQVRTFFLTYSDKERWMQDLTAFRQSADYIETFCSPSLQGTRLTPTGRQPFAEWLYAMHVSVEYDDKAPELSSLGEGIQPWKILHCQDETMISYLHRHDSRFSAMKLAGLWELQHPWYECLVPADLLWKELDNLLDFLPIYYATTLHVVPIANKHPEGFFMAPDQAEFYSVMILNPGVPASLVPGCLDAIKRMDERFLRSGGKRYLSGFLGENLSDEYWKAHFGPKYETWRARKQQYDPKGIFRSYLHKNHSFGTQQDKPF